MVVYPNVLPMYLSMSKIINTDANVFINNYQGKTSVGGGFFTGQKTSCEEYIPHTAKCILVGGGGIFFSISFKKTNEATADI